MKVCKAVECSDKVHAGGYCNLHYKRSRSSVDLLLPKQVHISGRGCSVASCNRAHSAKGFCFLHYSRRKNGTPENQEVQKKDGQQGCLIEDCENSHHCKGYCKSHWERIYRMKRKEKLVSKCGGMCLDCGDSFPSYVFDFDNVIDDTGHESIGKLLDRNARDSRIEEELARCELVCANCHRIRTYSRYDNAKEIQGYSREY